MVTSAAPLVDDIWTILGTVLDPEVPALSVVDLAIVRHVHVHGNVVVIDVTPTYSGCPATQEIERLILEALAAHGMSDVRVNTVFTPAWTTDWMTDRAREKLRRYGIAPPGRVEDQRFVPLMRRGAALACPFCDSRQTAVRSDFGSTACKSLQYCNSCHQPFEHFKAF